MERGKRKPALDLDYAGAEKKSRDEAQPTNGPPGHDTIQDTTLRPQDITFRPQDIAFRPQDSTLRPQDTTFRPQDSTFRPHDITFRPQDTTLRPHDITFRPQDSTLRPQDSTLRPQDTTLRPQDITFRPHHPPHHRSSQIEINLGHKVAFTRAEVEAILRRLSQLHRQELDEQYQTFQAVVTDCLRARTQTRWDCAYIS